MAPTHWMTVHPAPAKAARSIITPLEDPLAVTQITLLWEKIHPPKPGRGRGKDTGRSREIYMFMCETVVYDFLFSLQVCRSPGFL